MGKNPLVSFYSASNLLKYPSLIAQLNGTDVKRTSACILVDKEEIGSVGATGMHSKFFENMVADYIEETGNHVLYRVTPIFKGKELVARGVLMEGISIEDQGKGIQYNVYCYNNQPGIKINYATGTSSGNGSTSTSTSSTAKSAQSSKGKETSTTKGAVYVYSAKATKFHVKGCRYVKQISAANLRQETSRKKLIQAGYEPCKVCHP